MQIKCPAAFAVGQIFLVEKKSEERIGQTAEKILRSRIFSFLCIRIYVIGTEDRAEETHQGCVFIQVSLAENEVFRQAE